RRFPPWWLLSLAVPGSTLARASGGSLRCAAPPAPAGRRLPVGLDGEVGAALPGEGGRPGAAPARLVSPGGVVAEELDHGGGELLRVARRDQQGGVAGDLGQRTAGGGDHRGAAGHRLQYGQAEALVAARVHEQVGAAEQGRLVLFGDVAGQADAL